MRINLKLLLLIFFVLQQLVGTNGFHRQRRSATETCEISRIASIGSHFTRHTVGDDNFQRGDFPWIVALYTNFQNQDPEFFCTGTLISARHVITGKNQMQNPIFSSFNDKI